ncbi:TetR/AcrR family transcriptional regulator [Paramicrobacterium chengjingii]|uniref:TetR family transcriptional regulator n=1 Tax=Paramicrobacterium chengjingii TaxID=2769067 RepID=A0ABX6YGY3_9MICO|nr:TetR/AcrR family transcriptional regulator [Microbacterium chengjingii]QPZ38047.1 TetR family transcriptional regulator [Microbacterium chengjingii]
MSVEPAGRRERKNLQTRRALAEAALVLFMRKGYDQVSVKEIADAVDISVPTLFRHVPDGKEALIFDDGTERRESILAAVHERRDGQTVISALHEFMASRGPFVAHPSAELRRRTDLIVSTKALRDYSRVLWVRCEAPLADAIADELGRPANDVTSRALARYVLETPELISAHDPDPAAALAEVFELLERGVPRSSSSRSSSPS